MKYTLAYFSRDFRLLYFSYTFYSYFFEKTRNIKIVIRIRWNFPYFLSLTNENIIFLKCNVIDEVNH